MAPRTTPPLGGPRSKSQAYTRLPRRLGAAGLSAGLALGAAPLLIQNPAIAAVTVGENITAFPNRDMVVAVGYELGEELTIEVERNGVVIGRTSGPAVETPEGVGLEVNHGPLGDALPGDCWVGVTPNIIGGDLIQVTSPEGIDTMRVVDLDFVGDPQLGPNGEVFVEGTASAEGGARLAAGDFAVEFRRDKPNPRFRRGPFVPVYADATSNAWRATFRPTATSAEGLSADQQRAIALDEASWMAVADSITETTIAELGEGGGPAAGCEGAPAEQNAVAGGYESAINLASGDMVLSGTARAEVRAVSVTVGTLPAKDVVLAGDPSAAQTWSLTIPKDELLTLADGNHTIRSTYDGVVGANRTVVKDTVAPGLPIASVPAGTYGSTQHVSLSKPAGEQLSKVHWEIGAAGTVPDPDEASSVYTTQIAVSSTQTIKARIIDRAGNVGAVATLDYKIGAPPAAPTNVAATEGKASARVSWSPVTGAAGYNVYRDSSATALNSTPLSGASYTDGTVTEGTHTYAVRAVSDIGLESVDAGSATVTLAAPEAPRGLTTEAGDARVTLAWSPNTEADIAGYRVYRDGVLVATTADTSRSYIDQNVTNGVTYEYTIAAVDVAGNESPTSGVLQATPEVQVVPPGAPTIGTVVGGNASATVSWTAPSSSGGSPITEYRIEVMTGSSVIRTVSGVAGTATSTLVTGLTNGTAYTFRVQAVNSAGPGALSATSTTVRPAVPVTAPRAPVIGTAAGGAAGGAVTASARWTRPASNGGVAINGYKVRAQRVNASGMVLSTTISAVQGRKVRSLSMRLPVAGARYRFQVRARNTAGWGAWSAPSNRVVGR